jgi:hypothetical protein
MTTVFVRRLSSPSQPEIKIVSQVIVSDDQAVRVRIEVGGEVIEGDHLGYGLKGLMYAVIGTVFAYELVMLKQCPDLIEEESGASIDSFVRALLPE